MVKNIEERYDDSFKRIGLSRIVEISELARKLAPEFEQRTGQPFIYFQRGELDLPLPDKIKDAFIGSLEKGKTKYPKSGGEIAFKKAVIDYHAEKGISLSPENIVATYGGQEGLQLAFALFRGSRAAGFGPCWSCILQNIAPYTETEFTLVPLRQKDSTFKFNEAELERTLKHVDLFYFNDPHNPTGKVFSREEVEKIDYLCEKNDVILISDEPYNEILFDGRSHVSITELDNQHAITAFTFSKSFSATGLRIGYAISKHQRTIELMTRGNYTQTAGVHTPTQYAFADFLTNREKREELLKSRRERFQARRDIMYETLKPVLNGAPKPEGAFYFFPDLRRFAPASKNIDGGLLELFLNNGIAIVPGGEFGNGYEGYARFSFSGTSQELTKIGSERVLKILEQPR